MRCCEVLRSIKYNQQGLGELHTDACVTTTEKFGGFWREATDK